MSETPSMQELVDAVRSFLSDRSLDTTQGRGAFLTRVSSNTLAIVSRELAQGTAAEGAERAGLLNLLSCEATPETDLRALRQALCEEIRSGGMDLATPGLLAHLKSTTICRLKIDQPTYSGLKTAVETAL